MTGSQAALADWGSGVGLSYAVA